MITSGVVFRSAHEEFRILSGVNQFSFPELVALNSMNAFSNAPLYIDTRICRFKNTIQICTYRFRSIEIPFWQKL